MTERIEKLKSFLVQMPDDCFLNHALALEYIKEGDDAQAQLLFERNQAHDPKYIATYYHLGKLLERSGHHEEALELYRIGMQYAKDAHEMHDYRELQSAYESLQE